MPDLRSPLSPRHGAAGPRLVASLFVVILTWGCAGLPEIAAAEHPSDPRPAGEASGPATGDGAAPASGDLEVVFLDVGQGDAALLRHAEVTVLIDTGRHQANDVVPALTARGVDHLDLLVVTHPHADHIGQFDRVMAAVDVDEVWWSGAVATSQTFARAVAALEDADAAYEEPRAGDTTTIGPLTFEVVGPPVGANLRDLNNSSLAMRITYGDVRLLFTGDAEAPAESIMVSHHATTLDAEVLNLGHHGSSTSTTPAFLAAVDPDVAVYSAGAGNSYGHPHAEVLDRLDAAGVATYGTDVHGAVMVTTDGSDWTVTTERTAPTSARG